MFGRFGWGIFAAFSGISLLAALRSAFPRVLFTPPSAFKAGLPTDYTIGEVSELCAVKPHVLRYWEQEFPQLKPVKRRGNRRYYQRQDVLVIRQIRSLLYEEGFTIGGARQKLTGDEAKTDVSQSQQIIRQLRVELEDLLKVLRR